MTKNAVIQPDSGKIGTSSKGPNEGDDTSKKDGS